MSSSVQRRYRAGAGDSSDNTTSSGERIIIARGPGGSAYRSTVSTPLLQRDEAVVDQLMSDLEGWREVILLMDGLLSWERPRVLAGLYAGLSLLFVLMWLLDPTVLTTLSLLLLSATLLDYLVPLVAPRLLTIRTAWTVVEEGRYREISRRLVNARRHLKDAVMWLFELRRDRPTFYFALVVPCLCVLSVVGDRVNNMLLSYCILSFLLFLPGLRHHGFFTHARKEVRRLIGNNLGGVRKQQGKQN